MSTSLSEVSPGRFLRLARKELTEILRDRRTVLTLLLMPLLLYPLLSLGFRQFLLSSAAGAQPLEYRLGVESEAEGRAIAAFLEHGKESLKKRGGYRAEGPNPRPDAPPEPNLRWLDSSDLDDAVRRGLIDVAIRTDPAGPFRPDVDTDLAVDLELTYRDDSATGVDALHAVERLCREANAVFLSRRLASVGIEQRPEAVRPVVKTLPGPEGRSSRIFAVLVPLVLIMMTITGAVYPAIDLTAGERERGTLEVLIASPVPRWALLGAKYVAVVCVAVLTALVNVASMAVTLWASDPTHQFIDEKSLTIWLIPQILGLLLLLAAFYSGVLLALTSFARSFKEAQAYLIPLMLASLLPGMIGLLPGLRLEGPLAVAPLINIVLLARDLLEGAAKPFSAVVVVLTTALYAVAAVAVAARTFGAEAVLSAQESGWGELFRRPLTRRTTATTSGALLCLALMFSASFVLNRLIIAFVGGPVSDLLAAQAVATVSLFGAFPLVAAWFGRLRPVTGFRIHVPGVGACLAAVLFGVCLWPIAYEIGLMLRWLDIASLSKEQLDKVSGMLAEYRAAPIPVVVTVLGILPAVFEELFFRGYLLGALLSATRPWTAIITSALLFGVFHLVTGGGLAIERLPVSAFLGIVLGWLCWKSGSVFPGMMLHALHNSLLVLLGPYESVLKDRGWSIGEDEQLPALLLLGAVTGSALAAVWVRMLPGPANDASLVEDD
jgi:sodium transport system permease protein